MTLDATAPYDNGGILTPGMTWFTADDETHVLTVAQLEEFSRAVNRLVERVELARFAHALPQDVT